MKLGRNRVIIVMGDFKSRPRKGIVGEFGFGTRNERDDMAAAVLSGEGPSNYKHLL